MERIGKEATAGEVWRLESNEWVRLAHPEKLKPKPKEGRAENPLFTPKPSRVSGIGDRRYWKLGTWIPTSLPRFVRWLIALPQHQQKAEVCSGHGKQRISRLGIPDWGQMPCWEKRGLKWPQAYRMLRPPLPTSQKAGRQAFTLRAEDWKGFLWGHWAAQEGRLKDADHGVSPTKQLIIVQESHSQQVHHLWKAFNQHLVPFSYVSAES